MKGASYLIVGKRLFPIINTHKDIYLVSLVLSIRTMSTRCRPQAVLDETDRLMEDLEIAISNAAIANL